MTRKGSNADSEPAVDPEEFLRRMLQLSPEDAAEVRKDAAKRTAEADRQEVGKSRSCDDEGSR